MNRRVLLAAPAALGLAVALVVQTALLPIPIFYARADAGTLFLIAGIVVTALCVIGTTVWDAAYCRHARTIEAMHADQAEAHHRFLRRLDHELKNPLTGIRAGLVNLDGCDGNALASVHRQVDRLAYLTTELRKLADLERQPLEQERVDLGELLAEVFAAAQEKPGTCTHVNLTLPRIPWPPAPILGDRDLLYLALYNVVDNAGKFCRSTDSIEIRAYEDGPSVSVEVADTGPGIPEDELPHLGEELYRASTATGVEGSGLGLALVQAITQRHGGSMIIRSRLGQGTVVTLRFPVAHP